MRVVSRSQVTVYGDGFKEWTATIPTHEGATAADILEQLENAVSLELRSHLTKKKTIVVPNSAPWRDISMHLAHGYYLFAHVKAVQFFYMLNGCSKKLKIKPYMTIEDVIKQYCPTGTHVASERNRVFPSVTIDLVQRLNMGLESNPMHFKGGHSHESKGSTKPSTGSFNLIPKSLRALYPGGRVKDEAGEEGTHS